MANTKKETIVFFTPYLFPGGGDVVLLTLAEGFALKDYNVDFLLGRAGGPLMQTVPQNINLRVLGVKRMLHAIRLVRRYIIDEKPKAIIATQEHAHLIIILANLLAGRKTKTIIRIGIPFSVMFQKYDTVRDKLFIPILSKLLYRFGDAFVAVSEGIAGDFSKTIGVQRTRITVIHNPKDIQKIEALGKERTGHVWADTKQAPLIVASGRLSEQKDFLTLLKAFKMLLQKTDARLLILGDDGGERKKLENFIEENNLKEKVQLLGFVQNPYAYMARADVFASSSKWEGLPNVIIEALILGVPVVATDCAPGGAREILGDNVYGVLVPIGNHVLLSRALENLLKDEALRKKNHDMGRKRGEDFTLSKIMREYKSLLI